MIYVFTITHRWPTPLRRALAGAPDGFEEGAALWEDQELELYLSVGDADLETEGQGGNATTTDLGGFTEPQETLKRPWPLNGLDKR